MESDWGIQLFVLSTSIQLEILFSHVLHTPGAEGIGGYLFGGPAGTVYSFKHSGSNMSMATRPAEALKKLYFGPIDVDP